MTSSGTRKWSCSSPNAISARQLEFLQAAVEAFSQAASPALATLRAQVSEAGLSDDVGGLAGSYVHHYPLFFRRIPPERDDGLDGSVDR